MKCLYYAPRLFPKGDGVSNKVVGQVKGFESNGVVTELLHFQNNDGKIEAVIGDRVFYRFMGEWHKAIGIFSFYRYLYHYLISHSFDLLYVRYELNASPSFDLFLYKVKKNGIKVLLEIPTYPYDSEIKGKSFKNSIKRFIERKSRVFLKRGVTKIVTTSIYDSILGIDTIKISNAVDDSQIKLYHHSNSNGSFVMIGVAFIAPWHGYDRVIEGLKNYYSNPHPKDILFYLVGNGDAETIEALKKLASDYNLSNRVIFTGPKYGEDLDNLFNMADVAIGSLARHRSGNSSLKTLKNVEYAMRGLPFIYSEKNSDFDSADYIMKVPADDTPISIDEVIAFCAKITNSYTPERIRKTVDHLTWKVQISQVIHQVE